MHGAGQKYKFSKSSCLAAPSEFTCTAARCSGDAPRWPVRIFRLLLRYFFQNSIRNGIDETRTPQRGRIPLRVQKCDIAVLECLNWSTLSLLSIAAIYRGYSRLNYLVACPRLAFIQDSRAKTGVITLGSKPMEYEVGFWLAIFRCKAGVNLAQCAEKVCLLVGRGIGLNWHHTEQINIVFSSTCASRTSLMVASNARRCVMHGAKAVTAR